ncbi:putative integron gene cassette protein [Lysobacter dokdonensis DS-58]|uniref:Putative integron gene cassette protein n=1 Tax=Lysobacter dokdonensis DS-58 TaxID=1300345 RepID=A0A0A2WZ72_9GAMM|nr:antibiotic biosynthesis monooxygenase [Lysobacter dokdonensis]KGQ18279.1 putative integron gene cassette protein [Lysobacter dokdonensis DS-58]
MLKYGLLARLEAKPGMEREVATLLAGALPLAQSEFETRTWYAFRSGPTSFGIFDTFEDEHGREAHLQGQIAKALMDNADRLLARPPTIDKIDLMAAKN